VLPAERFERVEKLLRKVPFEFHFFQMVRLMERMHPERSPVGRFVPPGREVVRFKAHNSLPFPASEVQGIVWPDPEVPGPPAIIVNFFGLTGPVGLLPIYYTQLVVERIRAKDRGVADFLDMFNHRMLSLFYQAWEKYRFIIGYERGERDRFSHILMSLVGLGTGHLQNRLAVVDDSLLFYAGLLSLQPRSAAALEQILADFFDVPVQVEQFVGAWYRLDIPTQTQFDRATTASEQLGLGAIVGDEIWNQQAGARVRIGPMPLAKYLQFLPIGTAYQPLRALTSFFSRQEIDFEVQLVLQQEQVPPCSLGQTGDESPLLGWTTWARTAPMLRSPSDTILRT
jgi:type VI secretion system protein ImpH